MYWNVEDFVHHRTRYKLDGDIINMWVIVDLTWDIKNPPPLLNQFLKDYIELHKVAR